MSRQPTGRWVHCPECDALAMAVVPRSSELVADRDRADGKVAASCRDCGEQFYVHYLLGD